MKKFVMVLACGLAVSSCAKRPDAIVPVDIPMAAYGNLDCQGLSREYLQELEVLATVSKQQNDAATGDAFGVFLIGVPMSSVAGGDKEGKVAVAKGKVNALESSMKAKGCNVPAAPKSKGTRPATHRT
ncbi:hypothetical protein HGO37_05840 [Rhizobium sp. CG4]|jgi:hypothetical protein|uniref:hypothetical protein n=1 Tax=Rhizobium/Agrobacterium group TaxID=227290 RepID=UPI002034797A|nr:MULTISPECIES: hypothetical protein [Rhizobium/Agrobacterium group]MCM2454905.1 hypothetical protein [Rhizobium sp. CG4]MDO5895516.1 hypothetical protein [Agrobacterium sp. Azo12]